MYTTETAEKILTEILQTDEHNIKSLWSRSYGAVDDEKDILMQGINHFRKIIDKESECFVFGWIDQASLEIKKNGKITQVQEIFLNYRPEQCGDSGIITYNKNKILTLEMSFEDQKITINNYTLPENYFLNIEN